MLADNLRRLRKEKGWSQERLAQQAGVTLSSLSKIESGANDNPTIKTLQSLASALGVTLDDLAGSSPEK